MNRATWPRIVWSSAAALVVSLTAYNAGRAQDAAPVAPATDTAVASGREAFSQGAGSLRPWYDAKTDSERVVNLKDEPEPPDIDLSGAAAAGSALTAVMWVVVAVALALIVAGLIYVFLSSENNKANNISAVAARQDFDLARVEELPFDLDRSAEDLLGEAKRERERGNLRQAIIYLFSYQLLELDRRHAIRLTRGKTNRQYLREIPQARARLRQLLALSIETFEEAFFGARQPDSRRFDACWTALDEFNRLAAEGVA